MTDKTQKIGFLGLVGVMPLSEYDHAFIEIFLAMRKSFRSGTNYSYSTELDGMVVGLFVEGDNYCIYPRRRTGVRNRRLNRNRGLIFVDIWFQQIDYDGLAIPDLQRWVLELVMEGIRSCVERIVKEKIEFDRVKFEEDVQTAYTEIRVKLLLEQRQKPVQKPKFD